MAELVFLVTSSAQKLEEYRNFVLPFEARKGLDLQEMECELIADIDFDNAYWFQTS